jgi:hypothetical protein
LVPAVASALRSTVLAFESIKKLDYSSPPIILTVELPFLLYAISHNIQRQQCPRAKTPPARDHTNTSEPASFLQIIRDLQVRFLRLGQNELPSLEAKIRSD